MRLLRPPALRSLSQVAALLAALAGNTLLLGAFHDRTWWPPDEGNYAHVAERVLDGEVLNRDVQDIHLGYVNFLNAAALGLAGRSLLALRYPLMLAAALQAALVFVLFRRTGPWTAAVAALATNALGVVQFLDPTANWYCLALVIGVVLCLHAWPPGRRGRLEAVGLLLGLLLLFRQLSGVLAAMGVVAFLLLDGSGRRAGGASTRPWAARGVVALMAAGLAAYLAAATDPSGFLLFGLWPLAALLALLVRVDVAGRTVLALAGRLGLGGAAAALPLVVYHFSHGSWSSWAQDVVIAATALSRAGFITRSSFFTDLVLGGLGTAFTGAGPAAVVNGLFWALLPLAAAVQGGTLLARLLRRGAARPPVHPLPVVAPFFAVVSLHFQIPIYLFYTAGLSWLALLWTAAQAGRRPRRLATTALAAFAACAVVFHAGQPLSRGWDAMLRGERVPLVESAGIPRCGLRIDRGDLVRYRRLLEVIEAETGPGEPIFALPSNAELYFLSGRPNPFRFFNFALGVRTSEAAGEVAETLRRQPPALLFYAPDDKYTTPLARRVKASVSASYRLLERVGRIEVYRRLEGTGRAPENEDAR